MPASRNRRRRGGGASRGARSAASLSLTRPRKKKTNKFYLAGAILIAVLVIGSFGLTTIPFGGGGAHETGSADQFVPGIGAQQTIMPSREHVPDGVTVEYNTVPASSGEHYDTPVRCGFYQEAIPDERIVHNLEHGNIVVSYNFTDPALVDRLEQTIGEIGAANAWGVTRPYDGIPIGTVALAAWGILDTMEGIDPDRIERFFDAYTGTMGPEFENGLNCITAGRMP